MTTPYYEGNPDSKLLVLGEAPARVEMRLGRPLVGPSGEVFNDCLHAAGIARRQCYILNVWPFQVWKEKRGAKEYFYPAQSNKGPQDLLWETGKGFTQRGLDEAASTLQRIRRSSANLILALGQQATDLASGKTRSIMRWRGSILPGHERVEPKKVIPTPHPASTIHGTYLNRYLIQQDMEKAKCECEYADLRLPERNLIIFPKFDEVMDYFKLCRKAGRFNTDIEVINHQVHCFSMAFESHEAMTVPLADERQQSWWEEDEEAEIWKGYADLLGDPSIAKINQNIVGFDGPFLLQQNNIYLRGFLGDPMIGQAILYPDFKKGLDFITSIRTREPYYKDEGKMWKGTGDLETFHRYCGKDSCVSLEAWDDIHAELVAGDYMATYEMTTALYNVLCYMTVRGFKVDREKLGATQKRVKEDMAARYDELERIAEWNFNPLSPKQCMKYFYETKGLTPYKSQQTGNPTCDDKAMSRIYRKTFLREAKLVQEIRALEKLNGTYLEMQFDKDGRLRCSWDSRGTWTGRVASKKTIFGTGGNMQNLHPEFRSFLVAD